jgi:kumamolisin
VAGDADPSTGYVTRIDGQAEVLGGTSAVAPLWAALIARLNQKLGQPVGFLNPWLYQAANPEAAFHDIVSGNNGAYAARAGWDPCSGLGSPNGESLAVLVSGDETNPAGKS